MKFTGSANYGLSAVLLFLASCATEPATSSASAQELGLGPSTLDPPPAPEQAGAPRAPAPRALAAATKQVGYYDMSAGAGQSYQVQSIVTAGGAAVEVDDPSAAALTGLSVLTVTNPDNAVYGAEYVSRLADIAAAVQSGMVLVIHDREVGDAATILPASAGFSIVRDFVEGQDINIRDSSTVVTTGLTNASLDGGLFSNHGFAVDTSLPTRAKLILTTTTNSHIVTFCYPVGKGAVIYSTIPLDFYLQGFGNDPPQGGLANIYAPNVIKYALAGACAQRGGPRPTPNFKT